MYKYIIEVTAPNQNKNLHLEEEGKEQVIIEAIQNANNGIVFKRDKKKLEYLHKKGNNAFVVSLESRDNLRKPALSLRGFSAKLLEIEKTQKYRNKFADCIYNGALFSYSVVSDEHEEKDIDNNEAIKLLVEMFMKNNTKDNDRINRATEIAKEYDKYK